MIFKAANRSVVSKRSCSNKIVKCTALDDHARPVDDAFVSDIATFQFDKLSATTKRTRQQQKSKYSLGNSLMSSTDASLKLFVRAWANTQKWQVEFLLQDFEECDLKETSRLLS